MQNSGVIQAPQPRVSTASSAAGPAATASVVSSFAHDEELLVLQHLTRWTALDTVAGRAVPYLFESDLPVRPAAPPPQLRQHVHHLLNCSSCSPLAPGVCLLQPAISSSSSYVAVSSMLSRLAGFPRRGPWKDADASLMQLYACITCPHNVLAFLGGARPSYLAPCITTLRRARHRFCGHSGEVAPETVSQQVGSLSAEASLPRWLDWSTTKP